MQTLHQHKPHYEYTSWMLIMLFHVSAEYQIQEVYYVNKSMSGTALLLFNVLYANCNLINHKYNNSKNYLVVNRVKP